MKSPYFKTSKGKLFHGEARETIEKSLLSKHRNKVNLIFTSPPFPLNKKKAYGNLSGNAYKDWFVNLAPLFSELLTEDGSVVIELGNAWEAKKPVQSLLPLQALLEFVNHPDAGFRLCQEFVCYNPSRLPSPVQWVNVERIRVVDSFTKVWWMSKNDKPKANNRNVLRPYSARMKQLLKNKAYNSGKRPSQHNISSSGFLKRHRGSIMHNVIEIDEIEAGRDRRLPNNLLTFSNTNSNDKYMRLCRKLGLSPHPARMPVEIADFFIKFLTDEKDTVLDPFSGSNVTGFAAESGNRKWLSIEINEDYLENSKLRFMEG